MAEELALQDWRFGETEEEHDEANHICYTSFGASRYDDDPDVAPPATERISPDAQDPLKLDEIESNNSLGLAQQIALGFDDGESTAVLVSANLSDMSDLDYYVVQLSAGDILSVRNSGNAHSVILRDYVGEVVVGTSAAFFGNTPYPVDSPLFGDSRTSVAYVVEAPGSYYIQISDLVSDDFSGTDGNYHLDIEVFRPVLESEPIGTHQILYLDFDGATLDDSFHDVGAATLSPLVDFLPRWGLDPEADLDAVIDAVIARVEESLSQDIRASELNGDYDATGIPGQFDIEILNSRDHGEQVRESQRQPRHPWGHGRRIGDQDHRHRPVNRRGQL